MFTHPGRFWTSYGCVQAVIIVTLAILTLILHVDANSRTEVNLLKALNLTSKEGIAFGKDHFYPYPYSPSEERPDLIVPEMDYQRALSAIQRSDDITLLTTFQQEPHTTGSLISLSDNKTVYLGLQVSSRKQELRLKYVDGDGNQLMESVKLHRDDKTLSDDRMHKVAVSISGSELQVFFDCHSIYKQPMLRLPDRKFSASNMILYVAQENLGRNFLFKGKLKEATIVAGPNGHIVQCPLLDSHCPTCGQFRHLQNSIEMLERSVRELTLKLERTESRLASLPSCECSKHCIVNGVAKVDGESWPSPDNICQNCTCTNGVISCYNRTCDAVACKKPAPPDLSKGQCCPTCLRNCSLSEKDYEHGDTFFFGCFKWECNDGHMNSTSICPKLSCPESEQQYIADTCCKFCKGEDYCAKGHACHTNATCLNLNTKYTCTCQSGFQGDGFQCDDIDECAQKGGTYGNHCHSNTRCVNTSGSYICECLPGYRRVDKFNCVEINECDTGQHTCHEHAVCANTQGSYECRCKHGYSGDGFTCEPVCKHRCLNGGECVAPDVCSCRVGFIGTACEQDLDECATELHGCQNTSVCINMQGWYYCRCKPGYRTETNHNGGVECIDIDECHHGVHSCHATATCENTPGHFECHCPVTNSSTSPEEDLLKCQNCMFEDYEIADGGKISPHNQPCKICTCDKGVISCQEKPCNCSTTAAATITTGSGSAVAAERDICCPQCDPKQSCTHQELKHVQFKSGEQWNYRCQTCECLYGEVDCWNMECPHLTCDNPLPLQPGECCPRCENDPCNFFGFPANSSSSSTLTTAMASTGTFPSSATSVAGHPCTYKGNSIASGQSFNDPNSRCTTCTCKDGRLYCNYGGNCFGDGTLPLALVPATGGALRIARGSETDRDHHRTTSKAATTAELLRRPFIEKESTTTATVRIEIPSSSTVTAADTTPSTLSTTRTILSSVEPEALVTGPVAVGAIPIAETAEDESVMQPRKVQILHRGGAAIKDNGQSADGQMKSFVGKSSTTATTTTKETASTTARTSSTTAFTKKPNVPHRRLRPPG